MTRIIYELENILYKMRTKKTLGELKPPTPKRSKHSHNVFKLETFFMK